ncbi:hypothetical protein GX865_00320 [Candidatus Saccharibacteria bacterium]|jgi:hypothetical protein|nr:hypothetical protein [Candidatus Saccharibacteria bacterium]
MLANYVGSSRTGRNSTSIKALKLSGLSSSGRFYRPAEPLTKQEDAIKMYGKEVYEFAQVLLGVYQSYRVNLRAHEVSAAFGNNGKEAMHKAWRDGHVQASSIQMIKRKMLENKGGQRVLRERFDRAVEAIHHQRESGRLESDLPDADLAIAQTLCCIFFLSRVRQD